MSGDSRVSALEGCRSCIENLDHRIGDRYSFLDKGMPDREAEADAWREIAECEDLLAEQRLEYSRIISDLRRDMPLLLESWAADHAERLERLKPLAGSIASSASDAGMLLYLIGEHINEWLSVAAGRDEPVLEHPSLWEGVSCRTDPGI